jgi:two-component system, NarL family, response regulator NreC
MPPRIRIFLIDDHAVLRAGLRMLLNAENDMTVVGEAPDAVQGLFHVTELRPDIILMDISMPSGSGLDYIREMKQKSPNSLIIILTMHDDESYLRMALSAGVSGYVLKQAANTELLAAIRVVSQGGTYLHPSHRVALFDEEHEEHLRTKPGEEEDYNRLSPREKEILRLIVMGYTNRQAAEELYLSEKTIETYKSRLMNKLGFHSRIELVRYALRVGLIKS